MGFYILIGMLITGLFVELTSEDWLVLITIYSIAATTLGTVVLLHDIKKRVLK